MCIKSTKKIEATYCLLNFTYVLVWNNRPHDSSGSFLLIDVVTAENHVQLYPVQCSNKRHYSNDNSDKKRYALLSSYDDIYSQPRNHQNFSQRASKCIIHCVSKTTFPTFSNVT